MKRKVFTIAVSLVAAGLAGGATARREQPQVLPPSVVTDSVVAADTVVPAAVAVERPTGPGSLICREVARLLAPADFLLLTSAEESERSAATFAAIYASNNATEQRLAAEYDTAVGMARADSIAVAYGSLMRLNGRVADTLAVVWGHIFDNKTFCYNYIFDRLNRSDLIGEFQNKGQETMRRNLDEAGQYASDALARYRNEKALLLDYEINIARLLKLPAAEDSLGRAAMKLDSIELKLPKAGLRERNFIEYAPVGIEARSRYDQKKPIPPVTVYRKGLIYRILLGAFARPQAPVTFKGVYPLATAKGANGVTEYYAGGYATLQQAEAAVATLRKAGFKDPQIAVWENGTYHNLSKENAEEGVRYRVEIYGAEALSEPVRETVGQLAGGKDVTRTVSSDGKTLFVVSSFDTLMQAARLADAIQTRHPDLKARAVAIINQESI
ncbi:MAG: hypothetical protein LBH06_04845 [Rikenellaceae bacterium]|jgi:hypothetical protein|nr:hypothetical protein [Rikenellaceae bacterium]